MSLQLERVLLERPLHFGAVFMEMGDRFMLYTDYYTNYPAAVQLINVRACVFVCLLVCVFVRACVCV